MGRPISASRTKSFSPLTPRKAQSFIDAGHNTLTDSGLLWDGRAFPEFVDPLSGEVIIERGAGHFESLCYHPLLLLIERQQALTNEL